MSEIQYVFDPTGSAPDNLVADEQHSITEANYRDFFFIVPQFAPFFADGVVVKYNNMIETRILTEGIDYYLALPYVGATRSIGKPVYGALTLNNVGVSGIVSITYQTIGGEWTANRPYVLEQLAEKIYNPRLTLWDMITNVTNLFPPVNHDQNIADVFGQRELIEAIVNIGQDVAANRDQLGIVKHLTNTNNPHRVTKEQIGLGKLSNLPLATTAEVLALQPVDKYVTLRQVIDILSAYGIQPPLN